MENPVDNKDKVFKGQLADENFILFFRKHWLYMIPAILIFIIMCSIVAGVISAIVFYGLYKISPSLHYFVTTFSLIVFLAYTHWFFIKVLDHFLTICILTDRRLLAFSKSIYIKDLKEIADIGTIQEVKEDQEGLVRNFLKYGDIVITFASSSAIMILRDVPNVEFHFRALMRAREELMEKQRPKEVVVEAKPVE
jgi:hypothetical protein